MTIKDRFERSWLARCEYGSLGNRITCPCGHCETWRERNTQRRAHEAKILAHERARVVRLALARHNEHRTDVLETVG